MIGALERQEVPVTLSATQVKTVLAGKIQIPAFKEGGSPLSMHRFLNLSNSAYQILLIYTNKYPKKPIGHEMPLTPLCLDPQKVKVLSDYFRSLHPPGGC